MRRLTAHIKAIVSFPPEIREEFFKIIKVVDLMPGEWIPNDLPTGTSVFVEDGFLLLTRCEAKQWKCSDFYLEGTTAFTRNGGAAEMKNGSFRVRAAEPSRIYYLTREDTCKVQKIVPFYPVASYTLRERSFRKSQQRKSIFDVPIDDRIIYVDKYFRSLMRAPTEDLATFLGLKTEEQKEVLKQIQKIRLADRKQLHGTDN